MIIIDGKIVNHTLALGTTSGDGPVFLTCQIFFSRVQKRIMKEIIKKALLV